MKKKNESTNKAEPEQNFTYSCKVLKARETSEGKVCFNLEVNGVTIYNCWYHEYVNKEGKEGVMLSTPSQKGKDDKFYPICTFPIMNETIKADIIKQLEELV